MSDANSQSIQPGEPAIIDCPDCYGHGGGYEDHYAGSCEHYTVAVRCPTCDGDGQIIIFEQFGETIGKPVRLQDYQPTGEVLGVPGEGEALCPHCKGTAELTSYDEDRRSTECKKCEGSGVVSCDVPQIALPWFMQVAGRR